MTRVSTGSTIKERFAIRAFPTLLYFPPASEAIYKYSGKRELEALTAYAKGGWKETDAFDPSKEPPLPPRQSFTEQLWALVMGKGRWLFGFMGISIAIGIGVLLCASPRQHISAWCPASSLSLLAPVPLSVLSFLYR